MKSKITRKFFLSDRKDKNGEYPIYLRLIVKRIKADLSAGVSCSKEAWNEETKRIRNKPKQNIILNDYENKIEEIIKKLEYEEKEITTELIKSLLMGNVISRNSLFNYINYYYNKYIVMSVELDESTKSHYRTCYYLHIKNYLDYKISQKGNANEDKVSRNTFINKLGQADLLLINCNLEFVYDFDYWLINMEEQHRNTAKNQHKQLKPLFKRALIEGEIPHDPYLGFVNRGEKTYVHKLDREQLDILETHDLGGDRVLNEVRDCFVFACYTGLRISHALSLRINQIFEREDEYWMRTTAEQSKTDNPLELPILDKAVEVIKKYKKVQDVTGYVLPRRAKANINSYLKDIADYTGIDVGEPLHFHHSRHTFGTLICVENDIPIEATMKFMSHRDIRSTMVYADIRKGMLSKYAKQMNKSNLANDKKRKIKLQEYYKKLKAK